MGLFLNPRNARKAAGHLGTLRDNMRIAKDDKRRVAAGGMTHAEREKFELREMAISLGQEPAESMKGYLGWNDRTDGVRSRQTLIARHEARWQALPASEWMSAEGTELRERAAQLKYEVSQLTEGP